MLKIFDILRAANVKRWHIVETMREQRLAEHHYCVAVLAGDIASKLGLRPGHVQLVITAALFHDIEEVIGGDPPTPTKKRVKEAGADMNDIFRQYKVIDTKVMVQVIPDIERIIKCADHLDGVFFLRDHGVGLHAAQVLRHIIREAEEYFAGAGEPGRIATALMKEYETVEYTI